MAEDSDATETTLAGDVGTDSADPSGSDTPYAVGLAAGVAAWLLGYLVFYLRFANEAGETIGVELLNVLVDGSAVPQVVGWLFFNGQFVNLNVDAGFFGSDSVSVLPDGAALVYLVAPVFLLLAGVVVGYKARTDGPGDAAATGLLLVPGYLVCCAVGALAVFALSGNGASAAPDPVTALLLAGVVYPAVFGAVGALVGDYL